MNLRISLRLLPASHCIISKEYFDPSSRAISRCRRGRRSTQSSPWPPSSTMHPANEHRRAAAVSSEGGADAVAAPGSGSGNVGSLSSCVAFRLIVLDDDTTCLDLCLPSNFACYACAGFLEQPISYQGKGRSCNDVSEKSKPWHRCFQPWRKGAKPAKNIKSYKDPLEWLNDQRLRLLSQAPGSTAGANSAALFASSLSCSSTSRITTLLPPPPPPPRPPPPPTLPPAAWQGPRADSGRVGPRFHLLTPLRPGRSW